MADAPVAAPSPSIRRRAIVPPELAGERIDRVAATLFPEFSRARLQAWLRDGQLRADNTVLRPRDRAPAGAELALDAEPEPAVRWEGQGRELDLRHVDDHVVVVNKPPGLVVHPAAGHRDGTLVNALLAFDPELARLPRAGIVHRLDKDTSGLMVVARSLEAHASLVAQLQRRSVSREYLALVQGTLTGGATIDAPIGRHPRQRKKMAVVQGGGKAAVTHFRIEQRFTGHTLLAVRLETGRTHQIRVHLAHRNHPLVGDPVYGGRQRLPAAASPALLEALKGFRRQALHARRLAFEHPRAGALLEVSCELPADLERLLAVLDRSPED